MIRVAVMVNEFPPGPGGIGAHAHALASYFVNRGAEVKVLTAKRSAYGSDLYDRQLPFSVTRYTANAGFVLKLLANVRFLWRSRKWATHIILSGTSQLLLTPIITLFSGAKVLCVIHGHEPLMVRGAKFWWLRRAVNACNHVVAVSEFSKKMAVQGGFSCSIKVIPNGIHLGGHEMPDRSVVSSPLKLITVGSVTPRKGQLNVVRALPEIKARVGQVEYHVVGIPEMADSLTELANTLAVSGSLIIHGAVSDEERDMLLNDSHIFLLLSENLSNGDVEGFGIAVLEANYLGLPAIGSMGTGVEQAIQNGETGLLVNAGAEDQIATAVERIVNKYSAFSKQSVAWAKNHDWKKIGEQYWNLMVA